MNQQCTNCARLEVEVQRLEIQVRKLQAEVTRLRRIIDAAQALCAMVATEAGVILAKNQPKGVWAYNKGKLEAADRIGDVLYY